MVLKTCLQPERWTIRIVVGAEMIEMELDKLTNSIFKSVDLQFPFLSTSIFPHFNYTMCTTTSTC